MAKEVILLKLGEIALKGLNRRTFEDVLLKNIRRRLTGAGEFAVTSVQSTIYVEPKNEEADMDLAEERCAKVFGVVGYTRAAVTEKELPKIREKAAEYLRDVLEEAGSFKVCLLYTSFLEANPTLTKETLSKNFKLMASYTTESGNTENGNSNMRLALSLSLIHI